MQKSESGSHPLPQYPQLIFAKYSMNISLLLSMQKFSEVVKSQSQTDLDHFFRQTFDKIGVYDTENYRPQVLPILKSDSEFVFGRDHEKRMMFFNRFPGEKIQFSVHSIFGVPGVGKTTLAQVVYGEESAKNKFDLRAWVKVAGQEFGLPSFARGIIKSATGMSCTLDDLDDLDELVRDALQSYKCLIVLDEVEFMDWETWDHMRKCWFNVVGLGSKILITTCSKNVANLVSKKKFTVLGKLSTVHAWSLYKSVNSHFHGSEDRGIVTLCQGIPLSLKLMGSVMRFDKNVRELVSTKEFLDNIVSFMDVPAVLFLSIRSLPPQLFQCLLYCANFPLGYALNMENLIQMWIAAGLVKQFPVDKTLEEIGNDYFFQLLCRSFFTDLTFDECGEVLDFRMPGLIHKFAQQIARILYKGKVGYVESINENADTLSLALPFAEEYNSNQVETLILSPIVYVGRGLAWSLVQFEKLHSLNLSFSRIQEISDKIGALVALEYLNLSYTLIESLPSSIRNLTRIKTLNLSGCYHLSVLPQGICDLILLRHLNLCLCHSLSSLPFGIGGLRYLQSMPLFVVGKNDDCASLREIRRLHQLKGKLEIKNLEHVREIDEARDINLDEKDLLHLGLSWSQKAGNCYRILKRLRPNKRLRVLDVTGYMDFEFPSWIGLTDSLTKISITDCGCKELPPLGHLPFLKDLQLRGMTNLQRINPEFYGNDIDSIFPSLEQFGLCGMTKLKSWCEIPASKSSSKVSLAFPSIKTLKIEGCLRLKRIPFIPVLPELIICNSNTEILLFLNSTTLSSLLIKDMEVDLRSLNETVIKSVKKLVIYENKDVLPNYQMHRFSALEHFDILHCHDLTLIDITPSNSVQKMNISYCQKLEHILVKNCSRLIELVIEDCPVLQEIDIKSNGLKKLIIKHCPKVTIDPDKDYQRQGALEYLLVRECPMLEESLRQNQSQIFHVPCAIVENRMMFPKQKK